MHPSKTRPDNQSLNNQTWNHHPPRNYKLFIFKVELLRYLQPFCIFGEADLWQWWSKACWDMSAEQLPWLLYRHTLSKTWRWNVHELIGWCSNAASFILCTYGDVMVAVHHGSLVGGEIILKRKVTLSLKLTNKSVSFINDNQSHKLCQSLTWIF